MAATKQHEEELGLKYLGVEFVVDKSTSYMAGIYEIAKGSSGLLKPGAESVDTSVRSVVGPVYQKIEGNPHEIILFMDKKMDGVVSQSIEVARQVPEAVTGVVSDLQTHGVIRTAKSFYEPVAEEYTFVADVSHVNTRAEVSGYGSEEQLGTALQGADVVIVPVGVPHKSGMTLDDLFNIDADIMKSLCITIFKHCPEAVVNMISNPVNFIVPIATEMFKKANTYDPKKIFGVIILDVVRARTFYAAKKGLAVEHVDVPVVGGHVGITILSLFSQATPKVELSEGEVDALTKRTQDGGTKLCQRFHFEAPRARSCACAFGSCVCAFGKALNKPCVFLASLTMLLLVSLAIAEVHCIHKLFTTFYNIIFKVIDTSSFKSIHVLIVEPRYASGRAYMFSWSCCYMTFLIFSHKVKVKDPTPLPHLHP